MDLNTPLSRLTGVGSILGQRLERLGLFTIENLLHHYPFRYDDFSHQEQISELKIGETVTLKGELWSIKNVFTRSRKILTQAVLNDSTGTVEIVWFNQPWLTKSLSAGDKIQVAGKINRKGSKVTLVSPKWEKITLTSHIGCGNSSLHTGRLVPVYPETYGLTSKWIRQKIAHLLPLTLHEIRDILPEQIRKEMLPLPEALKQIHLPESYEEAKKARERLAFDELFYIQLATQKKRKEWEAKTVTQSLKIETGKLKKFIQNLPFKLTNAQQRVIEEITQDLGKTIPMNRLVQGEVGSGKTVVAAAIIYLAHLNGLRSVVMAPTEILAFQHLETLTKLLSPYRIEIGIYTGSKKYTQNQAARIKDKASKNLDSKFLLLNSNPNVVIGTHAVLSEKLNLDKVGLIVVDEQQRFGVEQRSILRSRTNSPHFLTMTATPIPRTVALTVYGDLDLSIIDELPVGRKVVRTHFVPARKRADSYTFIADRIKAGEQVYIITPLIDESETMLSAKAAKTEFERLQRVIFPKLKLGLLHGRLKSKEKEQVIRDFKEKKIDILVSTSVVEVGVDVPNATVMVIEGAERFGLAQLHQLRGRVGRGAEQSYALLFAEAEESSIVARLKNLERIHDGLELSELDLKIRGAGEVFGTRQSGDWNLKIASLSDLGLIEKTRAAAARLLAEDPSLDKYAEVKAKLTSSAQVIMPD